MTRTSNRDDGIRQDTGPVRPAVLWSLQGLLAALFLFTGVMKVSMPVEKLAEIPLPVSFLRFIGMAEVLGAIGLILPGLLKLWPGLTALAAAGLVIIMAGATVTTVITTSVVVALLPLTVGVLSAVVAYGRSNFWLEGKF
ncbi:MAG: DoxX family protein [Acidobacteriaceae bacterium]|nr:DoxX family protein [Acidobacteriaceae bacterium]